jgi:hypothetical protein
MLHRVETLFDRFRIFRNTTYVSCCCDALIDFQGYESDRFLVTLVRMQCILTRVCDIIPNINSVNGKETGNVFSVPIYVIMSNARKDLDELVSGLPPDVESNGTSTEIRPIKSSAIPGQGKPVQSS